MADPELMANKVVLITGGTGGIGKATAIGLAAMGARVGITGRDVSRGEQAAADIRAASGNRAVDMFAADMTSQAEVRRLAAAVLNAYPRLDVLINNVGGFWAHRHLTADGIEQTLGLNHLAPFLLTNLLLDRLKAGTPARVVTVSSGEQARGRIDFDDLQAARKYSGQRAYSQSKLANVMFTMELARRLREQASQLPACTQEWCERTSATRTRRGTLRSAAGWCAPAEDARKGRRNVDLSCILARTGRRHRSVLRKSQVETRQRSRLRHQYDSQTVERQRRAGRHVILACTSLDRTV